MKKSIRKSNYKKILTFGSVCFLAAVISLNFLSCPNPVQSDGGGGSGGGDNLPSSIGTVYVSTLGSDANPGDSIDSPKRTIGEALLRVADGGDILVAGGTYNETLIKSGSVNILGSYNEDFTSTDFSTHPAIIDGAGLSGSIYSGSNGDVELRELVLQNGTVGTGGGINFDNGSLTISECSIIDNTATEWGGGGINVGTCQLTISASSINNNLASRDSDSNGGGISAGNGSIVTLQSVDISYNLCNGNAGGGVFLGEAAASFTNCTFTENSGTEYGGGINAWNSILSLSSCTFDDNNANTIGGGVSSGGNTGADYETIITNCTFTGNSPNDISGEYINGDISYTAITPDHGDVFDTVTLTGSGFGDSKPDDITLHMGPTVVRADLYIQSWSDTAIVFYVPNVSGSGDYAVQLADSGSGPDSSPDIYPVFTVEELYVQQAVTTTNVDPESVEAGGQINITGTGYTPVPGSITVSGYECDIISWSETEISFNVPLDLEPSVYPLGGEITTPFGIHGGSAGPGFYLIPGTPQLLSNNHQGVQIQGQAVNNSAQYLLLRSDAVDGEYSQVSDSTGTSMTDLSAEPSTTYYYAYRGVNGGDSSPASLPLEVTTSANTNMYTVTFNSQGGSSVSFQEIGYGSLVSEPSDPTRTGYTFNGWYTESECTNIWDFATDTVTGDEVLFAGWTINQYTVSFDSDEGSAVSSQTVEYGGLVSEPAYPIKDSYVFDGWHLDPECTVDWGFGTDTVTGIITLYAAWLPIYTVTFDSRGGTNVNSQTVISGGIVIEPADPSRSGYTFNSWYKESSCTNPWVFTIDTITSDRTLYAGWTENQAALPVEDIIIRGSNQTLHVFWSEPSDPVRDHVALRYRASGGIWQTSSPVTSPYEISGLINGTMYEVEMISVNIQGDETTAAVIEGKPTNRLYVKGDANGGSSGSSWNEAIKNLEDALIIATSGMEIWVAEGVYTTPGGSNYVWPNGVAIYGGFLGNEISLSQADWEANKTYLETDAGTIIAGSGLVSSSILQGFILQGATDSALRLSNSYASIIGCLFKENSATTEGGAVNISDGAPIFSNCDFIDNSAPTTAGAVKNTNADTKFYNCRFLGNSSNQGGALYNYSYSNTNDILFANCIFTGNYSTNYGGVMYNAGAESYIYNSSLTGNNAGVGGNSVFILNNVSGLVTSNSIYWDNDGLSGIDCQHATNYGVYKSSIIQGGASVVSGTDIVNADPRFVDPDGEDNIPGTADDDLRLFSDSPGIDIGDASLLPVDSADLDNNGDLTEPLPIDIEGLNRVLGGGLNLGAHEATCLPPPLPVSDLTAEYTGNGTINLTWTNPSDPNLDHLEVWYKEFDALEYTLATESGDSSGTDVSGLTPAARYSFMVLGINSEGRASDPVTVNQNALYIEHYTYQNSGLPQYSSIKEIETDQNGTFFLSSSFMLAPLVEWDGNTFWTTWNDTNGFVRLSCGGLNYVDGQGLYVGISNAIYLKDTADTWTSWTTSDGLPASTAVSIADTVLQGTSSWGLFAATGSGIAVYDGSAWSLMTMATSSGMLSNNVKVVMEHPYGRWILAGFAYSSGGSQGFGIYNGISWENHTIINGESTGMVNDIAVGPDETIYLARSGGGVSSYNGSSWTTYNTGNSGLVYNYVNVIAVDPTDGTIYAGTSGYGLSIYKDSEWITLTTNDGLLGNVISDIMINSDGSFYVATFEGLSLISFDN
jgi:uncharacterized repeat protein (TIGR02543 family)